MTNKQKRESARLVAKTTPLPRQGGATAMKQLSNAVAQDVAGEYFLAKFTGEGARSPFAPIVPTSIVSDKVRLVLNYSKESVTGSGELNHNLTTLHPSVIDLVRTTASGALALDGAGTLVSPLNTLWTPGDKHISTQICSIKEDPSHCIFPFNPDQGKFAPGWQVFDHNALAAAGVSSFNIEIAIASRASIDAGPLANFGVVVETYTADGLVVSSQAFAGSLDFGNYYNPVFVSIPYAGTEEYIGVYINDAGYADGFQVDGTMALNITPVNATGAVKLTIPHVMRHLETTPASTIYDYQSNDLAVRTLTGLFSFQGPLITQGGFVAISEIKANERIRARDLVDYLGTRPQSYRGKIIEGAYGVYMEDSLSEFALHPKAAPYRSDQKMLVCVSQISDSSQTVNLVLDVRAGIEGVSNSLVYEQAVACPATAGVYLAAILGSMPRFSSNDNHDKEIINKAAKLTQAAASAARGKSSVWDKLWSGTKAVGKTLLPMLPSLLALL